jgi:hypothetical protein
MTRVAPPSDQRELGGGWFCWSTPKLEDSLDGATRSPSTSKIRWLPSSGRKKSRENCGVDSLVLGVKEGGNGCGAD